MSNGRPRNRVVLVVLDGWGYRREREGNAIELASTPVWRNVPRIIRFSRLRDNEQGPFDLEDKRI